MWKVFFYLGFFFLNLSLGIVKIESLKFFGNLNTTVKVFLTTKSIPTWHMNISNLQLESEIDFQNKYAFVFFVNLRNCERGEIYSKETKS